MHCGKVGARIWYGRLKVMSTLILVSTRPSLWTGNQTETLPVGLACERKTPVQIISNEPLETVLQTYHIFHQ
jgi:hypothetical protein